jgi:hypothetical protein
MVCVSGLSGGFVTSELKYLIGGLPLFSRAARDTLFENLDSYGQISFRWFGDEKMEMLRHDHITPDNELVFLSDFFESFNEQVTATGGGKKWLAMVATAGDEVLIAAGMKPLQTFGHGESL